MLVRDVMSTGVLTVRASDKVRTVVSRMLTRHCGAIPVVDGVDELIGLVAVRDVLLRLYPDFNDYVHDNIGSRDFVAMEQGYAAVLDQRVDEIMTPHPFTVSPDDPILKAASYMGLRNFRRIPVVERGRLLGMISIGDINRELFLDAQHGIQTSAR